MSAYEQSGRGCAVRDKIVVEELTASPADIECIPARLQEAGQIQFMLRRWLSPGKDGSSSTASTSLGWNTPPEKAAHYARVGDSDRKSCSFEAFGEK